MGIEMSGVAILNGRGAEEASLRVWYLSLRLKATEGVSYLYTFQGRGKQPEQVLRSDSGWFVCEAEKKPCKQ